MIRIRVLGLVELVGSDGAPLAPILAQPKRLSLLTYLIAASPRGFHRRDSLLPLFWPELDEFRARKALNQSVAFLRQELRAEGEVLVSRNEVLGVREGACWCDAVAFEEAANEGRHDAALALYRGGFLEGWFVEQANGFEDWAERQRARLRACAAQSAQAAADAWRRQGDYSNAITAARRATELSQADERAVRRLLELLDEAGDRAGALHAYAEFARRVAADFNAEPSVETRALVDRIRARASPIASRAESAAADSPLERIVSALSVITAWSRRQ